MSDDAQPESDGLQADAAAEAAPAEKRAIPQPPTRFEPGEVIFVPKGRGGTVGTILTAPDDEAGSYTIAILPGPIGRIRKDGTAPVRKANPTRTVVATSAVCVVPDGDADFQRLWRPTPATLSAFRRIQESKTRGGPVPTLFRTEAEYLGA